MSTHEETGNEECLPEPQRSEYFDGKLVTETDFLEEQEYFKGERYKTGSIIVVGDTHFGLKKRDQFCDPIAFSDFLDWIRRLEEKGGEKLKLGVWSVDGEDMDLKPPEKIVFLGDILELWDASPNSIDISTRSIIQSVSTLNCEKIYVLGNHDYDLVEIEGKYPIGTSKIHILEKEHHLTIKDKGYMFLHGHQFDKYFTLPSWKFMPSIRRAALVFGSYTWIFVALFAVDLLYGIIGGFGGIAEKMLLTLLGAISIPFLIIKFGRNVWNNLRSRRYNQIPREFGPRGFERWWKKMSLDKEYTLKNLNIIYGHTHIIDYLMKTEGNDSLTFLNIPSWTRTTTKKGKIPLEKVFRHSFLYVDEEDSVFIGWDTRNQKPFLMPKEIITVRREEGDLTKLEPNGVEHKLQEIGWPKELIDKWMEFLRI